jgi:hypothetical protein
MHELNDGIALLGIQAAQLVLDVNTVLAAQVEQVFALHVQFTRQSINPNFLFLQAQLPVRTTQAFPSTREAVCHSIPLF